MRKVSLPNINGEIDQFPCYTESEFDLSVLSKSSQRIRRKKAPHEYLINFGAFDIETTTLPGEEYHEGFMYHWQMCIAGHLIYGRTWSEWVSWMHKLHDHYNLSDDRRFVIYVHNLGFEYQFMCRFLAREFGVIDMFAVKSRRPLRIACGGFEFRCSYMLSNMSLAAATLNENGVMHVKQSGDLDYKILRGPKTRLNNTEFGYCMADVLSLYEYVVARMDDEHDNLESIPMTSTGYVRRDCRKSCEKDKTYRQLFKSLTMTPKDYEMLKDASRGGDTHANRYMSGRIWKDVDAYDVQSSYPAMLVLRQFPMSKFSPYGEVESKAELEKLVNTKACLFYLTLTNLRLKKDIAMPYIADAKLKAKSKTVLDNGRVLEAEFVQIAVTDIDYKLIMRQYDYDQIYVTDMRVAEYGYLPEAILNVVRYYFTQKTCLKGDIKKAKKERNAEKVKNLKYLYSKSKGRLNAIFGMMFTDPVHELVLLEDWEWKTEKPDIEEAIKKYYKSRNSFLYYAWGVWTTAHAREHLANLVDATGQTNTIYCDTDSSYAIDPDIERIDAMNSIIMEECNKREAYCDYDGERYYMGVYEHGDEDHHDKFMTLGAKKYVTEDNGEIAVTISGVMKEEGGKELERIDNFKPGFIFKAAGGSELYYNDDDIHYIKFRGQSVETASNIGMVDGAYTIGITGEYAELIGYNIY